MSIVFGFIIPASSSPWQWVALGWAVHILTFLLVFLHCLVNRREAVSAILWIFVAWSFPGLGPLLYLCFGINRVPEKGFAKHLADQHFLSALGTMETKALTSWRRVHEAVQEGPVSEFGRQLDRGLNAIMPEHPLLGGNAIAPLVSGDEAFPRMLEAVAQAHDHIHFQSFIIHNDSVGRQFRQLLIQKARDGVQVRLLYDRFGSTHAFLSGFFAKCAAVPNMETVGWTQANLFKRQFQVNLRNHRKLLIVDGKVAFAGGINISRANVSRSGQPPIRDYHFELRGPIVQELQYSFLRDWYFMTGASQESLLTGSCFPEQSPTGSARIRLVSSGPSAEQGTIADVFFMAIVTARRQILAVTPYFVPTGDIVQALRAAAMRGVDVRLIVPEKNNHVYTGLAGRSLYDDLLSAGVRLFERRPPFLHAKALIVDDAFALVGTANLDVRSLRLNYETNLAVYDEVFVNQLKRIMLEDQDCSRELNLADWRGRPLRDRMLENFSGLLTPIL